MASNSALIFSATFRYDLVSSLYLNNNQIEEVPANLCAFTDDVESLTFAHNKLKKIPNIFAIQPIR